MVEAVAQERLEALGPAEKVVQTLLTLSDHMFHNRPGLVVKAQGVPGGVKWEPCTWKQEGDAKVVYVLSKVGNKQVKTRVGVLGDDGIVRDGATVKGEYRKPSDKNKLFPEVAVYLYRQIAEVFKLDNEFVARWASYAFYQANRDLKVVLAAFLLVQNRAGAPFVEDGEVLFHDDDYRAVGEAMFLYRGKGNASMEPKLLPRVGDLLKLPEIAEINRELGFGRSGKNPAMGRYDKAVTKWLAYREANPAMLEGLVQGGMRNIVIDLARRVHYKPQTAAFYETLRWKQKQAPDGRRTLAIGQDVKAAESWAGLDEKAICQRIVTEKPGFKRIVGLLPKGVGLTRAIMAAAIEAGSLSNKDLILAYPTLEALGLLNIEPFSTRLKAALAKAEDQRAMNIAKNVKSKEAREALQDAADMATAKTFEKVTRGLRVYCMVDISASMENAIARAIQYLTRFLGGFPADRVHVSVFNTVGREITIKAPKAAAVAHAFQGHRAGGGTIYASGVEALKGHRPKNDEDVLFMFVGDQAGESGLQLATYIQQCGLNPVAFGYLRVVDPTGRFREGNTVQMAARHMGIPCFDIDENMFTSEDPYAVTRVLRDMIAATPVGTVAAASVVPLRKTLVEEILQTPLLQVPVWAAAA